MMQIWILIAIPFLFGIQYAHAQNIIVNATTKCWENFTAGPEIWRQCGIEQDWLQTIVLPFEYATGGYFSMFVIAILCLMTYQKYKKAVYPLIIGTVMLPASFALFPTPFLNFGFIFGAAALIMLIAYIFLKQTRDF